MEILFLKNPTQHVDSLYHPLTKSNPLISIVRSPKDIYQSPGVQGFSEYSYNHCFVFHSVSTGLLPGLRTTHFIMAKNCIYNHILVCIVRF